uniref:C2 domain-containing protein n=1 Tax=Fagus sylvatica TaxID=28930 RepID=A0A2N9G8N1_FAGSY
MFAVWMGTQADEVFSEAWCLDAAGVTGTDGFANIRSKEYLSPKLWYLRVNVIEAMDLQPSNKSPEVFVKANLGNQVLKTRISERSINPSWNESLMFVAAEPFEEPFIVSVEDGVAPNKHEVLGKCAISFHDVDCWLDYKRVSSGRWYNLEKHVIDVEGDQKEETKFAAGMIHMEINLQGGYHVLDESTNYCSDFRPTAKELWKPRIGVLGLGILHAKGLLPMKTKDGQESTDAYCVARYGQKWVRTRTLINSFEPKWNEQYSWDVFDPCTVITIGVFDNCHLHGGDKSHVAKDSTIGKVRIRLSTLETNRVYTHLYPLLVLQPSGVKKMGEIHLAVRFTCSSLLNTMHMYSQPLLPNMHYLHPLSVKQLDSLRHCATQIVWMRLSLTEPPLRKEVVESMLDVDSHMWSLRRSKSNFFRLMNVLSGLTALAKWYNNVCYWRSPRTTILIHMIYIMLLIYPALILPILFLCPCLIVAWKYIWRPRGPPHIDVRLSHADLVIPDELDEEFDTFPTSRSSDVVRMRYDRLRSICGKIQTVAGDMATIGERLQNLVFWRDPRATVLFMIFLLVAAIIVYVTPIKVVALLTGFYVLRHPRYRSKLPSIPLNFFRRLPPERTPYCEQRQFYLQLLAFEQNGPS